MIAPAAATALNPPVANEAANIANLLERAAEASPSRPAVIQPDGTVRWRFGGLGEGGARLAGGFQEHGVGPGARVLALVPDPSEFVLIAAGVLWAGATLVVPPRMRSWRDALRLAGTAGPSVVIAPAPLWLPIATQSSLRAAPIRITSGRWALPGTVALSRLLGSPPTHPMAVGSGDAALISFSSGTTGLPKPIVRTHGVLRAQHEALETLHAEHERAVDLPGLPLLALHNLARGVPSVLLPPGKVSVPDYGAQMRAAIHRTGVTAIAGFPALFDALCRGAADGELRNLHEIHIGGAPVRSDTLENVARTAPHARTTVVYGCTEAEPIAASDAHQYLTVLRDYERRSGMCVGPLVPGIELSIAPLQRYPLPPAIRPVAGDGSVGRIRVRGPRVVTPAGAGQDEAWHDTGDLGWQGPDGRLWLLGRAAHASDDGLLPGAVEPALEQLPWVNRAVMLRISSGDRSQSAVVTEPRERTRGADTTLFRLEIQQLLAERGWSIDLVAIVDRIPHDARSASKVDYSALTKILQR